MAKSRHYRRGKSRNHGANSPGTLGGLTLRELKRESARPSQFCYRGTKWKITHSGRVVAAQTKIDGVEYGDYKYSWKELKQSIKDGVDKIYAETNLRTA